MLAGLERLPDYVEQPGTRRGICFGRSRMLARGPLMAVSYRRSHNVRSRSYTDDRLRRACDREGSLGVIDDRPLAAITGRRASSSIAAVHKRWCGQTEPDVARGGRGQRHRIRGVA